MYNDILSKIKLETENYNTEIDIPNSGLKFEVFAEKNFKPVAAKKNKIPKKIIRDYFETSVKIHKKTFVS